MHRLIVGAGLALLLAGCGGVLPHETHGDTTGFKTYGQLMGAYDRIAPGRTRLKDLSEIGFDPLTTPNVEFLSSVDIAAHFMPTVAITLERLPPAVRDCIVHQDRCTAYRYRLSHSAKHRNGGVVPDLLGVERDTVNTGWSASIILLVQNGYVTYKTITSRPYIEDRQDKVQPLGPLQDLGRTLNPPPKK